MLKSGWRAGVAVAAVASLVGLGLVAAPGHAAGTPLSIRIVGNHFVDGSGATIRLLGVNRPSGEYACVDGYDYGDWLENGDTAATDTAGIASWTGANVVRVPLNEDCWLGSNGQPSNSQHPDPALTQAGYQKAIEDYVADLHAHGLYAILDLHWTAPGTAVPRAQRSMPDDHSAAFWTSVAGAFKSDPAVVFDAYNEPTSEDGFPISWDCWLNGGCQASVGDDGVASNGNSYTAVGMQALVNAIRGAGAGQPIMLGGLSYANDLSQWLAHEPSDPLATPQLAASFHVYEGNTCASVSCWSTTTASVAAKVPVVAGEFDEDETDAKNGDDANNFDNTWMRWADGAGVSYLAWGWFTPEPPYDGQTQRLVKDVSGTPEQPNGVALHDHLAALVASGSVGTPTPTGSPKPPPASPSPPSSPTAQLTTLKLRFSSVTVQGQKLTVKLVQVRGFTGHLQVTVVVLVGRAKHTLGNAFLVGKGTTVTLPKGAKIVTVTVAHAKGGGYTSASVKDLGGSVKRLPLPAPKPKRR